MKMFKRILCCVLVALFAFTNIACTASEQQLALEILGKAAKVAANEISQQIQAEQSAASTTSPAVQKTAEPTSKPGSKPTEEPTSCVQYGYDYNTPQEVADYIHLYKELPPNYITKSEAQDMGWESSLGNLYEVTGGMSIGGDYFSNYQKLLPTAKGRKYYECDVNYNGGYRGAERLVYSNDGLIFYTEDHYESFTQLY